MRQTLLATLALAGLSACSNEQFASFSQTYQSAHDLSLTSNATVAAASALSANVALYQIAAALSQAATQEFDDTNLTTVGQAVKTDLQVSYDIDRAGGKAKLAGRRDGSKVLDLAITFESSHGNGGVAYTVTSTTGTVDGFSIYFPTLVLSYTAVLDNALQPQRDADGKDIFSVDVSGSAVVGIGSRKMLTISQVAFSLKYPFTQRSLALGSFSAVDETQRLEGKLTLKDSQLALTGTIYDSGSGTKFTYAAGADGRPTIQAAH